ncbi:hypothetical protein [Bacillus sp. FJAT-49736]|uniref:hypothetical protein n=1 Tax=Bacillus sp. FJAT-49736 TaxID=2833582 RepID=UPI001BCA3AE4|nr:hypothetical protein [Bacillus sp. FJAT-49736]MBS4173475.1 hypothetical protein [Bacillus sp. FJAT-49736]
MENFEQVEQSSENNVEVAEPQTQVQQEQSANTSEVANPNPVQDADTNAYYADMRRKQELDQYRTQAETAQQQLDRAARLAGYQSHEELVSALDEMERQQQLQEYEQAGINPDVLNKFLEQHPAIQYAKQMEAQQREQERFQNEANEFFSEFPNVKAEDIQPEVFQLQQQKGLSLLDAYLRVNYKSFSQQAEQQTIQKLQSNALSSPGALGGGEVNHNTSISSLSSKDFSSLVDQVLRGERKQL